MEQQRKVQMGLDEFFAYYSVSGFLYLWLGKTEVNYLKCSKSRLKALPSGLVFSPDGCAKTYRKESNIIKQV